MVTVLTFLSLVALTVVLYGIEKRLWKQSLTPFALLAFPFIAVSAFALILTEPLDFQSLSPETIAIWIIGLLIFWLGGLVAYLIVQRFPINVDSMNTPAAFDGLSRRLLLIAAWVFIIIISYAFMKYSGVTAERTTAILSDDFQEAYGAGLFGYARAVAMFLLILLIGEVRGRDIFAYVTITAILMLLFTTMVKGTIMLPLMGGLLYRVYSGRTKLTWKGVVKFGTLLSMLFFAPYTVALLLVKPTLAFALEMLAVVARNFFLYLFSGVLSLGDALRTNTMVTDQNRQVIFAPLLNLYNNLTAAGLESVRPVTHYESMIDRSGIATHTSNVHTIFGTLYMFLGPYGFVLYVFVLGICCYTMLFLLPRGNCWMRGLIALIFAALTFGWFEFYYWHTLFYIPVAFALLVYGCEYLIRLPLGGMKRAELRLAR